MAVIIGRQKMTVDHVEGEHTIFPSTDPQSLPDHLLDHPFVQGGIRSGWITVVPTETADTDPPEEAKPAEKDSAPAPRRRRSA